MQRWITATLVMVMLLGASLTASAQSIVPGGLTAIPAAQYGPNLLTNGGFETAAGAGAAGWTGDANWGLDQINMHGGAFSLRRVTGSNSAYQTLNLNKGVYRLSGWVKTSGVSGSGGIRLVMDFRVGGLNEWQPSNVLTGTQDWTYLEVVGIVVENPIQARVVLDAYQGAGGTAYFDDMKLEPVLPAGVEPFLLYPNYRGIVFDDGPSTLKFSFVANPPGGDYTRYDVRGTLKDEATGQVLATQTWPAAANGAGDLDGGGMQVGRGYLATFTLIDKSTGSAAAGVAVYPAYRVSRMAASARSTMTISFDTKNRVLVRGTPRFILGVYDSGLNYNSTDAFWEQTLWSPTGPRRLGNTKINFYLNYWYGQTDATSLNALMTNLQKHGVMWLQTSNCFDKYPADDPAQPFSIADDAFMAATATHPGLAGYYVADECIPAMRDGVFTQNLRVIEKDPDSMNFAALLGDNTVGLWRDSADVLSTDPYPMFSTEPAAGYSHIDVANWTRMARDAVQDARPYLTVLQFFKFGSNGRWPTLNEMRAHAYMAVVEGAKGLFWWSIGNGSGALATVCDWCPERAGYMNTLTSVINELADLEPALIADDVPGALAANSNGAIKTKVKVVGGRGYLFAYNSTNATVSATFTWQTAPGSVTVNAENRTLTASGTSFTDSFGPYAAHAYVIANGGSGGNSLTVSFTNPAANATVSGTTTVTMSATGGNSTDTYKLAVDGTNVYTGTNPSFSWNTTTVSNASHTLTATVTDSANATGTATRTVTVNNSTTTPPSGGTVDVYITSPTTGNTVTGTAYAINVWVERQVGTANEFTLSVGGQQLIKETLASTHQINAWDTTKHPNGPLTLTATVKDSAGSTGTATVDVTVSNAGTPPPPPPALTAAFTAPTPGATVSGGTSVGMAMSGGSTSTTLTAAAIASSNTFTLAVDGTVVSTQTVAGTSATYTWDTTKVANGSHTLDLTVKDAANTTATASATVTVSNVVTPPPPPSTGTLDVYITSPLNGVTVSGTGYGINVWLEKQSGTANVFTLAIDGAQIAQQTISGAHLIYALDTTKFGNGSHTLVVTARDATGKTGTGTVTFTVSNAGTTPPPAPAAVTAGFTSPASGATVSGTAPVGMSASGGTGGYTYALAIDGTSVSPLTASGGTASYAWNTTTASNASHTLALTVKDGAGATATATRTVTVSNTVTPPPTGGLSVYITSPKNGATVSGTVVMNVWLEKMSAGTNAYTLLVDGKPVATTTGGNHVYFSFNSKTVPNGTHTLTVTAKDSAGKTGTQTITVRVSN